MLQGAGEDEDEGEDEEEEAEEEEELEHEGDDESDDAIQSDTSVLILSIVTCRDMRASSSNINGKEDRLFEFRKKIRASLVHDLQE